MAGVYAANSLACGKLRREVNQMKLFTSLAVIAGSLGERDEGQSLVEESVALALFVFAAFGAIWLLRRMA
jgi:hypothetical protein